MSILKQSLITLLHAIFPYMTVNALYFGEESALGCEEDGGMMDLCLTC